MKTQSPLLSVLIRREGPAVSLSITTLCRSIISLMSEASVKSVELRFNEQPYKGATSFTATTEVSEKLNSDNSIADNTFFKERNNVISITLFRCLIICLSV